MSASYTGITANDSSRMHVGAHHGDVTTTYNSTSYSPAPSPAPLGGLFGGWAQRKRNKAFMKAVEEKQKPRADMLFRQGVDIDYVNSKGFTALHLAAKTGYLVEDVLAKGYDINAKSHRFGTPLCIAAYTGHTTAAKQLIAVHANLSLCGSMLLAPLYAACARGHFEIAKDLVEAGAALDAMSEWSIKLWYIPDLLDTEDLSFAQCEKGSPLIFAIRAGSTELVEYLLQRGASVNAQSWYRLHTHTGATKKLAAIICAVEEGSAEILEILLRHGADVNTGGISDGKKVTALTTAVRERDATCTKLLLAAGARTSFVDQGSLTPLHHATDSRVAPIDCSILRALINYGAKATAIDAKGRTPLHCACFSLTEELAQILLVDDADVDAKNFDGCTPLHLAAQYGNPSACRVLLDHGADPFARDESGSTPRDLTLTRTYARAAADLLERVELNTERGPIENVERDADAGSTR